MEISQVHPHLPATPACISGLARPLRSVALYGLSMQNTTTNSSSPACVLRLWEDEVCASANSVEIAGLSMEASVAEKSCVEQSRWADGGDDSGELDAALLGLISGWGLPGFGEKG